MDDKENININNLLKTINDDLSKLVSIINKRSYTPTHGSIVLFNDNGKKALYLAIDYKADAKDIYLYLITAKSIHNMPIRFKWSEVTEESRKCFSRFNGRITQGEHTILWRDQSSSMLNKGD